MKIAWQQCMILRAASLLAPGDQRAEWLDGWRSELWYVPRRGSTRFCLGAFQDALWLRRNNLSPVKRTGIHWESPFSCLAFLTILATASMLIAVWMPAPRAMTRSSHLSVLALLDGCMGMLMLSSLALPVIILAMGRGGDRYLLPWPSRLRRGLFLTLKIAILQPILFGGFVISLPILSMPIVNLGFGSALILAFRWVLVDQRRRCPVCLRLLTDPVRIGSASQTFLEWYGAESTCSRGHGLMQVSEMPASYSAKPEWLALDESWRDLFSDAGGVRQR